MGDIDQTKKSVGVDKLAEGDRKEMFDRFQSAGGKVVSDSPKKNPTENKNTIINRDTNSSQDKSRSKKTNQSSKIEKNKKTSGRSTESSLEIMEQEYGSFLNRILLNFRCFFSNVSKFGKQELKPSFFSELNLKLTEAFMEFYNVGQELVGNKKLSQKLVVELDKKNPIFLELINKFHELYDKEELDELFHDYQNSPNSFVPVSKLKEPLFSILRKLYCLYNFQDVYKTAISEAYKILLTLEDKPHYIYDKRKKKIHHIVTNLFRNLYFKLYLAVIRHENKNIPPFSPVLEKVLGISESEKIGKRKTGEGINQSVVAVETKKQLETQEEEILSDELSHGLKLMRRLKVDEFILRYDPKKNPLLIKSDKAYLTYLFFKEFDEQYSIVLTTKKIELKTSIYAGVKVDFRQKLFDIYELSRGCLDQYKLYLELLTEFDKQKKIPSTNYIETSKRISIMESKRNQQSKVFRESVREFMNRVKDSLLQLINDMKLKKEIVMNSDQILSFDLADQERVLKNKQIKNCIIDSYSYALAFFERLDHGDLYGGLPELSEEDMKKSFPTDDPSLQSVESLSLNTINTDKLNKRTDLFDSASIKLDLE